jgi:hypothetical protein
MSKKALLVGINYIGTNNELAGCINDVLGMKDLLIKNYGYKEADIILMTDNTTLKPTRKNILLELFKLILSNCSSMFFHYSGHGSYIKDSDNDEQDGNDETLVPIDFMQEGLIIDDELRGLLQCVQENSKLTVVLDCCHSGSGLDLAYNVYERVGRFSIIKDSKEVPTRGQIILFSGCQDPQTSADTVEENKNQGALTYCFTNVIKQSGKTYEQVFREVKTLLKDKKYSQIPNLSSGKLLSLSSIFNL